MTQHCFPFPVMPSGNCISSYYYNQIDRIRFFGTVLWTPFNWGCYMGDCTVLVKKGIKLT